MNIADQIGYLLEQVSYKDFFDIFIVALLIFQVLKIVHGTRAFQILLGLFFLFLLYLLGIKYDFHTLNWILNHFFNYFLIIFIIIFQNELRSTLATAWTGKKVLKLFNKSGLQFNIEEIIRVAYMMSRDRRGGLIVIEGRNGLQNYIDTGTKLNSEIHSDLLYSIFQINSPFHDGAVIIRKDQISSVSCFLPLSEKTDLDRNWGTRHRAALGLSEVSDAVIITISEETGKVKLCFKETFHSCEDEESLRRQLKNTKF